MVTYPPDASVVASILLTPRPESAGVARRHVQDTLTEWGCTHLVDAAVMVTSELVTNAVVHGEGRPRLTLALTGDEVQLEVTDRGRALPRLVDAGGDDEGGRGLALVAALATVWGVSPSAAGAGKTVWCRLA